MTIQVGTTLVTVTPGLVRYTARGEVDGDGAPNCYAPEGSGLRGLDAIGNAWDDGRKEWVGVICTDAAKQFPVVQGPADPCPGFLVAATALQDARFGVKDPLRYVDATRVCYVSIAPELERICGVRLGDLAWVSYGGRGIGAVVADIGPHGKLGELSIASAEGLGIPSSPRNGGVGGGVDYAIFPGSAPAPWTVLLEPAELQRQARAAAVRLGLLDAAG